MAWRSFEEEEEELDASSFLLLQSHHFCSGLRTHVWGSNGDHWWRKHDLQRPCVHVVQNLMGEDIVVWILLWRALFYCSSGLFFLTFHTFNV